MAVTKTTIALISIIILAVGLRFYHLGSNPPALYWEEAAIGYDAYSILKTGKDFHGNFWPVAAFESFGDWKPSLYFYAAVPSIAVFGLTPLGVRLPSALAGILTVVLVYFLVKDKRVGLAAAAFLAISPWHLQLSRAAFEANLGLFLVVLGWFWPPALVLSMYAYHANRLLAPLLFLLFWRLGRVKNFWLTALICGLIAWPLLISFKNPAMAKRFQETSALTSLDPIIKSNELIAADGDTFWARLSHHRYWQYTNLIFANYLDHFDFDFLFLTGDVNPRHSIQTVGGLFLIQLPLIIFGLKKQRRWWLWLLLAPLPSALTIGTPHALRSLAMIIPFSVLTAVGLSRLPKKYLAVALAVLALELSRYLVSYYRDYPRIYTSFWQAGYREMVAMVKAKESNYEHIYITRSLGRPSTYYWFFTATDPRLVQVLNDIVPKDQGEYLEFGKIKFGSSDYLPGSLIVSEESGSFVLYEN